MNLFLESCLSLLTCNFSLTVLFLQQCSSALKKYAKRFQAKLDREDITFVNREYACDNTFGRRRRRESHHRNKRDYETGLASLGDDWLFKLIVGEEG